MSNITPTFMTDIFIEKNPLYHLRSESLLQIPKARTFRFRIESIALLGYKMWHGFSNDAKPSLNISIFKKRIKEYKGVECNCQLCKTFVALVGFLNLSCFTYFKKLASKYISLDKFFVTFVRLIINILFCN